MTEASATGLAPAVDALIRFSANLRLPDLPASVIRQAKNRLLDTLGCMLAGVGHASSQMVRATVAGWGGRTDAVVAGTSQRLPAALAAFCNGAAGHAVELDDDHKQAILHPGVCVVPAALAAAEARGASGRELLEAVVVGYEVMCRVGEASLPARLLEKGFHPTGVCGVFGAAAAVARLRGLEPARFRAALGIAGSFASGLFEFVADGSLTKRLHPANAAKSGILASELAAQGYSGPASILEGRLGFFNAFAGGHAAEPLRRPLGQPFEIERTSYKQHACCSYCHPLMDALVELLRETPVDAKDVDTIVGRTFSEAVRVVGEPLDHKQAPASPVDAQFSGPYCVAVTLLDGVAMPQQFTAERVHNPEVQALTRRVRVERDPALDREFPERYPAEIVMRLRDGRRLTSRVETSKGDPRWPLSDGEIADKFRALAATALSGTQIAALEEAVERLDSAPDVRALAARLAVR